MRSVDDGDKFMEIKIFGVGWELIGIKRWLPTGHFGKDIGLSPLPPTPTLFTSDLIRTVQ
jgi:hypothetical protein